MKTLLCAAALLTPLSVLAQSASPPTSATGSTLQVEGSPQAPACLIAQTCIAIDYIPLGGGPKRTAYLPAVFSSNTPPGPPAKPAAIRLRSIFAGIGGSYLDPDYGHSVNILTGAFVGFTGRYLGAEARADYTAVARDGMRENSFLVGPRVNVVSTRRLTVFARAGFGAGRFSGDPQNKSNRALLFAESYGGGADLRFSRHIDVRLVDASYTIWPGFTPRGLTPIQVGAGIVFRGR